jgi:beta-glucosidase
VAATYDRKVATRSHIRVDALIATMTLEEKVAQLSCMARVPEGQWLVDDEGHLDSAELLRRHPHGLGQLGRPSQEQAPAAAVRFTNAVQETLAKQTRLGIGALFNEEGIHGHMAVGATSYPAAIALASTWDTELVESVYTAVAREVRSRGSNYVYAPVLDLARDPRWGRVEETLGEDPYLTARLGVAAVRGLQGMEWSIPADRVLACAKHFAGHGVPEAGMNGAPLRAGEREMREHHLVPFEAVVKEAGVAALMAAYHEIDGVPCHGNGRLLIDLLRTEWGFEGMVSSDGFGVPQLVSVHKVASDEAEAGRIAIMAGVDNEVPEPRCFASLSDQVRSGALPESVIDRAVANVLNMKDRLGLLDPVPAGDPELAELTVNCADHQALALEAARRSIVLLSNREQVLPLEADSIDKVAVIGPHAADLHLGGYAADPGRGVTLLEGLRQRFGDSRVLFAEGCRVAEPPHGQEAWWADEVTLTDPQDQDVLIAAAVEVAVAADVVVLAVGGSEATCREGWWYDHLGDRDSLDLPGRQGDLVAAVADTGTPVVAVVMGGRPLVLVSLVEQCSAVLQVWYPGQEGGTAVAEVLSGDVNPSGKLPVTMPRSIGQLPIYMGRKPSTDRGYLFASHEPLFPFGHGLSYTTFSYGPVVLSSSTVALDGQVTASVEVSNTGDRAGSEVVQLYVRDRVSSVTRPERFLRRFSKVELRAGETHTVRFDLRADDLALVDRHMKRIVEPGEFEIYLGGSSTNTTSAVLTVQ